ncbi:MAG: DUF4350 domain-containing protein [Promethearchaeota archaeon]
MRNIKRKRLGSIAILIAIIASFICVNFNIYFVNSSLNYLDNNIVSNQIDKIDPLILDYIGNKGGIAHIENSNVQKVIVILDDSVKPDSYNPPKYVEKLQSYPLINGFLGLLQINKVFDFASLREVKSIWFDHVENSSISDSQKQQIINFLNSAANGNNAEFVNFTSYIGAQELWKKGINGSGVIIAIMDSGVDLTGQIGGDLDDFDDDINTTDPKFVGAVSLVPEEPFYYTDFNGKGTYHAGIACGTGALSDPNDPSNKTYAGVAPGASFLNVKIYDSFGLTYWSFMISGIEWAISHSADIMLFCRAIIGAYLDPVSIAITNAVKKGIVVVAPTGDEGPSYMSVTTPGGALGAISVGAYDTKQNQIANFSSRGPGYDFRAVPDILAPGVDLIGPRAKLFTNNSLAYIESLSDQLNEYGGLVGDLIGADFSDLLGTVNMDFVLPDNMVPVPVYGTPINENYTRNSGTGAAAAVVAGAIALLIQAFPLANPQIIRNAICETANPITNDLNSEGSGVINISAAYDYLYSYFGNNPYETLPFSVPLIYGGVVYNSNTSSWNETALGQPINMSQVHAYDMATIISTQALMDAVIILNGTTNETLNFTQIHMPLNQFGLRFDGRIHWLSEFKVARELHQMSTVNAEDEDYNRYIGILEFNGIYVVIIIETWNYVARYINIGENRVFYEYKDRVNGFKIHLRVLNLKEDQHSINNLQLVSYFKADMFMNETGALNSNNTEGLRDILNVGNDDNITFDPITQTMIVSDMNNDTNYSYPNKYASMGFNSTSHNVEGYRIDDSIALIGNLTSAGLLGQEDLPIDYFDNNSHYIKYKQDPGFAIIYNLSESLDYGNMTEFSGLFSVGIGTNYTDSKDTLYTMMNYMQNNVTNYEIKDLAIVKADFHRMQYKNEIYHSEVLILNVGNTFLNNCQIGFVANRRADNEEIETFSILKPEFNMNLYDYKKFDIDWVPQETGIYLVGWVVIDINLENIETYQEDNILNNIMSRSVYVIDREFYSSIQKQIFQTYPNKLDQNPWKIHFPGDIGIFNITIYSIMDINDVTVSIDGHGDQYSILMWQGPDIMGLLNQSSTEELQNTSLTNIPKFNHTIYKDVLHPFDTVFIILFGPLLCPPGITKFNITFSSPQLGGIFYRVPVELEFHEYRGRIFFDGIHNFFTMDTNLSALMKGESFAINLSNFIDLEERFDYPFAHFSNLKELWSNRLPKGVAMQTILPGIELNISEYTAGLMEMQSINNSVQDADTGLGLDINIEFNVSILEEMLGGYYLEGDLISTNTINHNILQLFDVLIINDPETKFNSSEIEDIVEWVERGGALLVWAENGTENQINSLNQLLAEFNLTLSYNSEGNGGEKIINLASWHNNGDIFPEYNIGTLFFQDPVTISIIPGVNGGADKVETLCSYVAVAERGKGRVFVSGDKDIFTNLGLIKGNNSQFAQKLIEFGLKSYFDVNATPKSNIIGLYDYNVFYAQIENYATDSKIKEYVDDGILFLSSFIYQDGTIVNASFFGFEIPLMLMFETNNGGYATSYNAQWYNHTGTYYVALLIDDPAAAQEMIYLQFEVEYAPEPPTIKYYEFPPPLYPHWIDIVGICWIIIMALLLWIYNIEKWKTRYKVIQIKGPVLNQVKTRINEGETLFKQLLKGIAVSEDEQDQIRLILSYRKRLNKYLKDLKKFGDEIGEKY